MKPVVITKRGADRIRRGHLWIYRSDVVTVPEVKEPTVRVHDQHGNFVGQALYSDRSEITLRLLTRANEPITKEWWRQRIRDAAGRRENVSLNSNAYRLVNSEGDLLPSLIVDRYADVLVLQTLSQGTEAMKPTLVEILTEEFQPRAIVERNDARVRELEGLPLISSTLLGHPAEELEVMQHGVRFVVSPLGGQKTGSFLDQRENRLAAQSLAQGKALDCFTFSGAFALHLAPVCDSVEGIDISSDAIEWARRNAKLNDASNVNFREANVFDALREFEEGEEKFDTIVLDPPAFAKNRGSVKSAARGYKEINLRALRLLNRDGILVTCSCSYHMSEEMFFEIVKEAADNARRKVQLVEKRTQSSDHPILVGVPESYYLKCLILRVIE
jgi:23S rRNA (cytosine1962-C5)-methyltransferase